MKSIPLLACLLAWPTVSAAQPIAIESFSTRALAVEQLHAEFEAGRPVRGVECQTIVRRPGIQELRCGLFDERGGTRVQEVQAVAMMVSLRGTWFPVLLDTATTPSAGAVFRQTDLSRIRLLRLGPTQRVLAVQLHRWGHDQDLGVSPASVLGDHEERYRGWGVIDRYSITTERVIVLTLENGAWRAEDFGEIVVDDLARTEALPPMDSRERQHDVLFQRRTRRLRFDRRGVWVGRTRVAGAHAGFTIGLALGWRSWTEVLAEMARAEQPMVVP